MQGRNLYSRGLVAILALVLSTPLVNALPGSISTNISVPNTSPTLPPYTISDPPYTISDPYPSYTVTFTATSPNTSPTEPPYTVSDPPYTISDPYPTYEWPTISDPFPTNTFPTGTVTDFPDSSSSSSSSTTESTGSPTTCLTGYFTDPYSTLTDACWATTVVVRPTPGGPAVTQTLTVCT